MPAIKKIRKSNNTPFSYVYAKSLTGKGYFGAVLEVSGVVSQGRNIEELEKNLMDAALTMIAANRKDAMSMFEMYGKEKSPIHKKELHNIGLSMQYA